MWTCPECSRSFANRHQWHSCIELTLESKLAGASEHAAGLYRAFESAVADCGEFRIHPQKTRIAFIAKMTFAGARLARRWIDVSLITPEPIDDERICSLACYGPTSFGHELRLTDVTDLDAEVRQWLCVAKRRGDRDTLDPAAHVDPLVGRPLELVIVPLRSAAIEDADVLALKIPRYAAEVFAAHPAVRAKVGREEARGLVEAAENRWWVSLPDGVLEGMGYGVGETVDVTLRADL